MTVNAVLKGKALLVIERLDSRFVPFDVRAYVQSCSNPMMDARDCVEQDFGLLGTDALPLPDAAYKLKVGQKVTVSVVYAFVYTSDYWGEHDIELEYHKQRVIRRH